MVPRYDQTTFFTERQQNIGALFPDVWNLDEAIQSFRPQHRILRKKHLRGLIPRSAILHPAQHEEIDVQVDTCHGFGYVSILLLGGDG